MGIQGRQTLVFARAWVGKAVSAGYQTLTNPRQVTAGEGQDEQPPGGPGTPPAKPLSPQSFKDRVWPSYTQTPTRGKEWRRDKNQRDELMPTKLLTLLLIESSINFQQTRILNRKKTI